MCFLSFNLLINHVSRKDMENVLSCNVTSCLCSKDVQFKVKPDVETDKHLISQMID